MKKREAELKDGILNFLKDNSHNQFDHKIAEAIGFDVWEVNAAVEEMVLERQVVIDRKYTPNSTMDDRSIGYLIEVLAKGVYDVSYNSYKMKYHKVRRETIWKRVKIAAAVLNALAIIVIGVLSLVPKETGETYDDSILQEKIESLEKRLMLLEGDSAKVG